LCSAVGSVNPPPAARVVDGVSTAEPPDPTPLAPLAKVAALLEAARLTEFTEAKAKRGIR